MSADSKAREKWLTMRLTEAERARLAETARLRGVRVADVVRQSLGPILAGEIEAQTAPAGAGQLQTR